MKKYLIPTFILIAYSALLIKVMVFKDMPTIRIGHLMLNFGGTAEGQANFVPFKTILPYLLGYKGWIIAGINLIGNIALLVPIGFLAPFIYRNMTWKKSLTLAIGAGLVIEIMQVVLRVGIFDIDDVLLNAFGVMIGYWVFVILAKWVRERKYKTILITAIIGIASMAAFYSAVVYPMSHQPVSSGVGAGDVQSGRFDTGEGEIPQSVDLCGGTGGNGQIVSIGNGTFVMKGKDGSSQIVNLAVRATIRTSAGVGSESDLKIGNKVTLVGGPNPDGSFTADAVFVCNTTGQEIQ